MKKKYLTSRILMPNAPEWKIWLLDTLLYLLPLRYRSLNRFLNSIKESETIFDIHERFLRLVRDNYRINWNGFKLPEGPVTIVSNHRGGRDYVLMPLLLRVHNFKILANKRLVNIFPKKIASYLIPVDITEEQGKKVSSDMIKDAYKNEEIIVWYPAGLVARYNEQGKLQDSEWMATYLSLAQSYQSKIIVVHCDTRNTRMFYLIDRLNNKWKWFKKLRLTNLFQILDLWVGKNTELTVMGVFDTPDYKGKKERNTLNEKYYKLANQCE